MTKREKEMLFDAEKSIYELRKLIKERGEFASLTSGFFNGLGFALSTFDIETSEDFEEETLALMDRIVD